MNNNPMMQTLYRMLSSGNNPNQIVSQIVAQHPQASAIINQMKNSGMTPKQFAMQYAKQNNINIQPMINMLNQRNIKL